MIFIIDNLSNNNEKTRSIFKLLSEGPHEVEYFDPKEVDIYQLAAKLTSKDLVVLQPKPNDLEVEFINILLKLHLLIGFKLYPSAKHIALYDSKVLQALVSTHLSIKMPNTQVRGLYNYDVPKKEHYPVIFKVSGGAGSKGVRLVRNRFQLMLLISKLRYFGSLDILKFFKRVLSNNLIYRYNWMRSRSFYLIQDYLDKNLHDLRITVIGDTIIGFERFTKTGDWRASGSGIIKKLSVVNSKNSKEILDLVLPVAKNLPGGPLVFDLMLNHKNRYEILEISCDFDHGAVEKYGTLMSSGSNQDKIDIPQLIANEINNYYERSLNE